MNPSIGALPLKLSAPGRRVGAPLAEAPADGVESVDAGVFVGPVGFVDAAVVAGGAGLADAAECAGGVDWMGAEGFGVAATAARAGGGVGGVGCGSD